MQNFKEKFSNGIEKEILFDEPYNELGNLITRTNELPELFLKMQKTGDDRSFVIISALVLESILDKFLENYIPKYKKLLEDEENFAFSTKINLIKSMDLIPSIILSCAQSIRKIRNIFAHDLEFDSLEKIEKEANSIKTQYNQIYSKKGKNSSNKKNREIFSEIASFSILGIMAYTPNIAIFNKKIRSEKFKKELNEESKKEFEKQIEELSKEKPIELIEKEGFKIKKYQNGIIIAEKI